MEEEDEAPAPLATERVVAARRRSSAAAIEVAAALYGEQDRANAAPVDRRAALLDNVLKRAAAEALGVVPAQRSVVFTFDRATNMLSAHVTATGDGGEVEHLDAAARSSFPPTVGMVGACFLQKRCLRMQEPRRHPAFRREYDVPKDVEVDSIICAPVIVRHRVIAIIQLLNRVDGDSLTDPARPQVADEPTKPRGPVDDHDVQLHRVQSFRQASRNGFSAKDEQKLIQLSSHIAHMAETQLKRIDDQSVTHAKLRELQANNALDLLNILNARLERQGNADVAPAPRTPERPLPRVSRPFIRPVPTHTIKLFGTLAAIMRLQARFRSRREKRSVRYSHALEQFRQQHERIRSAITLQRVTRGCIARKQVRRQRRAAAVLSRAYGHYRFRVSLAINREMKRQRRQQQLQLQQQQHLQHRPTPASPPPPTPASPRSFKRRSIVPRAKEPVRTKAVSATAIQRHVRGHQIRTRIKKMTGFTNLSRGLRNIIKLQSFVRGGLARIRVRRSLAIQRKSQAPPAVCLRIGLPPAAKGGILSDFNASTAISNCCVYQLPERRTNAHLAHNRSAAVRHRLETLHNSSQPTALSPVARRGGSEIGASTGSPPKTVGLEMESRRLISTIETEVKHSLLGSPSKITPSKITPASVNRLSKAFPSVVLEIAKHKGTPRPPAVEYASDRLLTPAVLGILSRRRSSIHSMHSRRPSTSSTTARPEATVGGSPNQCSTENSNQIRRQPFSTAGCTLPDVRHPMKQPLKTRRSDQVADDLLCCFLPAQPKPGIGFRRGLNSQSHGDPARSRRTSVSGS